MMMTKLAENYNARFQLILGDNFYFFGVENENDKRFNVNKFQINIYLVYIRIII